VKIGIDVEITQDMLSVPELARTVEDAGLESLLFMQCTHVPRSSDLVGAPGHEHDTFILDPLVTLAVAGACTSRLLLGTGALYPAFYDPIILARELATLDHVMNGRLLVGVTPGYDEPRFRNHGIPFDARFRAFEEKCLALRMLWSQSDAEFHGEFVDFDPVVLGLVPVQRPNPPMLIGSQREAGLRRTVAVGDAWFPVMHDELDLDGALARLSELAADAGRDRIPVTGFLWDLDEQQLERCAAAGVDRCVVALTPTDRKSLDEFLERCAPLVRQFGD
jgi:probable F420-dependent oxidoreductase